LSGSASLNGEADRGATPTIFSLLAREGNRETMRDKCVISSVPFFSAGEDAMLRQE